MRLLREKLVVLEYTQDSIVLRETPHHVIGWAFIVLGVALATVVIRQRTDQVGSTIVIALACVWILTLGLLGLVTSTISIDRRSGILRVRRRLLGIDVERQVGAQNIDRVYERKTLKGNGLVLGLAGRRKRGLTLFTEYKCLSEQAAILNHLIHGSRKYAKAHADSERERK